MKLTDFKIMHTQKLYGASDDLIELNGDVSDELPGGDDPVYMQFSTGTYVKIWYGDEGVWKIEVIDQGKATILRLVGQPDDQDDETQFHNDKDAPPYSDVLIIESEDEISLDVWGKKPIKKSSPNVVKAKKIIDTLEDFDGFDNWWNDIEQDDKNEILEAIAKVL